MAAHAVARHELVGGTRRIVQRGFGVAAPPQRGRRRISDLPITARAASPRGHRYLEGGSRLETVHAFVERRLAEAIAATQEAHDARSREAGFDAARGEQRLGLGRECRTFV